MDKKNERRTKRNMYRSRLRRAAGISDYLLLAAPQLHLEAVQFFDNLQRLYPKKKDLRKTKEFMAYQKSKLGVTNKRKKAKTATKITIDKTMVLNIELNKPTTAKINSQPEKANNNVQDIPIGPEGDQLSSIFEQIPTDVMNQMVKDINADPDLKSILDQFDFYEEEVLDEGDLFDLDIDIDINDETPLEKELNNLYN